MNRPGPDSIVPASRPFAPPPIKLVAIDLDGTLLNDSKQVSDQTVAALKCLPARGVKVVIASARPPRSVKGFYQQLGLDTWQINYNGALVWDAPARCAILHRPMAGEMVLRIALAARELFDGVLVSCEVMDRWYTDRMDTSLTTETGRMYRPDIICDLQTMCGQEITKLLLLADPQVVSVLEQMVQERFAADVSVVKTDDFMLQIMKRGVGKASALQHVAGAYGVPLEQVMAIGDAPNDVGMIRIAGVGIAMDNAHPLVIDAADWIAPSNNDHGVHAALVRYGLCV